MLHGLGVVRMYELTIATYNDAHSGLYESRLAAMDAADEAAAIDGLTARYGSYHAGCFVDSDQKAWFTFTIRPFEKED